jgi:hypothetical protein
MKKINFNLDDLTYKNFKKYCVDQDKTMTTILIELINEKIEKEADQVD